MPGLRVEMLEAEKVLQPPSTSGSIFSSLIASLLSPRVPLIWMELLPLLLIQETGSSLPVVVVGRPPPTLLEDAVLLFRAP